MQIPIEINESGLQKTIGDYVLSQCFKQIQTVVSEKATQETIKQLAQISITEFLKSFNPQQLHEKLHQLVTEEVTRRTKAILKNM